MYTCQNATLLEITCHGSIIYIPLIQPVSVVDPSRMVDDWRLTDGFVAEEGKVLLPNLATIRPNLVENHTALLLAAWIRAGILDVSLSTRVSNDLDPDCL